MYRQCTDHPLYSNVVRLTKITHPLNPLLLIREGEIGVEFIGIICTAVNLTTLPSTPPPSKKEGEIYYNYVSGREWSPSKPCPTGWQASRAGLTAIIMFFQVIKF
jgi:hypothetical protein